MEDNIDEIIKPIPVNLLGFLMTACTYQKRNLLADNPETMEKLFANCKSIIAIHSEKEKVEANEQAFREQYGEDVPVKYHPLEYQRLLRSYKTCD
jgi:dihydroorotase